MYNEVMLNIRVFITFILSLVVAVGILSFVPAGAQERNNELYEWKTYKEISASYGIYKSIGTSDSGQDTVKFEQDENNPYVFTTEATGEDCEGELKITLDKDTGSRGTVTHSGGECPGFKRATKNARIEFLSIAVKYTEAEAESFRSLLIEEECGEKGEQESACQTAATNKHQLATEECRKSHDYILHIANANKYLDCIAQRLGLERDSASGDSEEQEIQSTCEIPDIGWVACQLLEFVAGITDYSFELLRPFLEIDALSKSIGTTNVESDVYKAWKNIRDIANIIVALGLMVVVLSQVGNIGLSTYHIKKGLPRIIVASLLVNISFVICGLLVDISNITGSAIENLTTPFENTTQPSKSTVFKDWSGTTERIIGITPTDEEFTELAAAGMSDSEKRAAGIELPPDPDATQQPTQQPTQQDKDGELKEEPISTQMIVNGTLITGTAVLYANLAVLVPIMVFSLFAMFTAIIILLFRWAIVIVLAVISPLAFAAILLPGTNKLFGKWASTITQMVMIYPIIALLYSGARIASDVIGDSAANNGQTILAVLSLGIQVIPLFVTPIILKFGGGAIQQFSGRVNATISPLRNAGMKKAKQFQENRKSLQRTRAANDKVLFGKISTNSKIGSLRPANITSAIRIGQQLRKSRLESYRKELQAKEASNYLSGVTDDNLTSTLEAQAAAELKDIKDAKIDSAEAMLTQQGKTQQELESLALTGKDEDGEDISDVVRSAAIRMSVNSTNIQHALDLIAASGNTMDLTERQTLVSSLRSSGVTKKAAYLGASALNDIENGKINSHNQINKMVGNTMQSGGFSPDVLTRQDSTTLAMINNNIQQGSVPDSAINQTISNARAAITGGNKGSISRTSMDGLQRIASSRGGRR